jgi:hypothetical protein
MSSNNSNGDAKKQQQHPMMGGKFAKERRQEMELLDRFRNLARHRIQQLANQEENASGNNIKHQMGEKEQEILLQMNGMGLKEGVVAGLLTFVTLRKGPVYMARWLAQRRNAMGKNGSGDMYKANVPPPPPGGTNTTTTTSSSGGGYRLSDPNIANQNNPFQRAANEPPFPRSRNIVLRGIWFLFDGTLSLMMAASVSMAYTDVDYIRDQLIDIPLVEGRSLISDAICQDVMNELKRIRDEGDPAYERLTTSNHPKTPAQQYLESIIRFSENCERRKAFEHTFRQERGMQPNEPVDIPPPGVPKDGPRLITLSDGTEMEVVKTAVADEDTFRDDDTTDWASDFVTDQEEQQQQQDNEKKKKNSKKGRWW